MSSGRSSLSAQRRWTQIGHPAQHPRAPADGRPKYHRKRFREWRQRQPLCY